MLGPGGPSQGPWRLLGGPLKGPWRTPEGPLGPTPCPSLDPHRVHVGPTLCPSWTHTVSKFGPTRVQVWTHTGPSLDPHRVQFWTPTVSKVRPASFPGPRYCLIPWSQGLPHTLVPGTASYPGPRYCPCRVQKNKKRKMGPNWTGNGPFGLKLGPNESNRNFAQF